MNDKITAEKKDIEARAIKEAKENIQKAIELLNHLQETQDWVNWSLQEQYAPVLLQGVARSLDRAIVHEVISHNNTKPNFNEHGHWKIDPKRPLTGKPEGLSDDAVIVVWADGERQIPCLASEICYWGAVTAFTVLEPRGFGERQETPRNNLKDAPTNRIVEHS